MNLVDSILGNIDESVIVTDEKGKILFFNNVALILSREVLEEPLQEGASLVTFFTKSGHENVTHIFREVSKNHISEKSYGEFTNSSGTTYHLQFTYVPVLNEEGKLTYIHTFIRDITPQKVFEKKLTTLATNNSNLIENANAIIIGIDTRGYITDWNTHCVKITGYEKNEVYAQGFSKKLLAPSESSRFEEVLKNVLDSHVVSNFEITIHTKTGQEAIIMLSSTIRTTPTGAIMGIIWVGQDVTELTEYRRSLEQKVEERTRELKRVLQKEKEVVEMKSRFVSIASHEFRTPLSSIQVAANFIKNNSQNLPSNEIHEKLNNIEKQIRHMTHLLDDVLTYGKNETGKIQLILSTVSLQDFINKIMEDVRGSTRNTHDIKLELGDLPEVITTDEKLLRSVLINLLTNAIKFSPGQTHIKFGICSIDGALKFYVRDRGIGIPESEFEKVFEPFLRGANAASIQGTGLGLSIVKKAVELLSGTIELESKPGEGTTFNVTIPLQVEHKQPV